MLEWRENNGSWYLFDNDKFVGSVLFGYDPNELDFGFWNGNFYTSDDGIICEYRISKGIDSYPIAKDHIEKCYLKNYPYSWWMR